MIVLHFNCTHPHHKQKYFGKVATNGQTKKKQLYLHFKCLINMSVTFIGKLQEIYAGNRKRVVDDPQATNLFLVVEPLFVAVSACDWYPMITFGGTPNLSL